MSIFNFETRLQVLPILLFIIFIGFSCDSKEPEPDINSGLPLVELNTHKTTYVPYEIVSFRTEANALGTEAIEATINNIKVQLTPGDSLASFFLPDIGKGSHTLIFNTNNKRYTLPVLVSDPTNVQSPEIYLSGVENQINLSISSINAQADHLSQVGGTQAEVDDLRNSSQKYANLLKDYKTQYAALSAQEKQEFAKAMAANKEMLDEYTSLNQGLMNSLYALRTTQTVQDYEEEVTISMKAYAKSVVWTVGHIPIILTAAKVAAAAPDPYTKVGAVLALGVSTTSFMVNAQFTLSATGILLNKALKPYENLSVSETVFAVGKETAANITTKYRSLFQGDEVTAPGGSVISTILEKYKSFRSAYNNLIVKLPDFLRPGTTVSALRSQFASVTRSVHNKYVRISNVSNPNVTLTQLNQADGSIKLKATTGATTDQTFTYDVTYSNGGFSIGLSKTMSGKVVINECEQGDISAPVITNVQFSCGVDNSISILVSFTANGSGILYKDSYRSSCDPAELCYPVRLYFKSSPSSPYYIAANGYEVSLHSGDVNKGVVAIQIKSCVSGKSARESLDAFYPGYKWQVELLNNCNQKSARVTI